MLSSAVCNVPLPQVTRNSVTSALMKAQTCDRCRKILFAEIPPQVWRNGGADQNSDNLTGPRPSTEIDDLKDNKDQMDHLNIQSLTSTVHDLDAPDNS